jgi:serine/threonine protein kinase
VESFGWYEEPDSLSIVMEYLPLGDLAGYMKENAPLGEGSVSSITSQVVEGLSFMHETGFAHRDLKPDVSSLALITADTNET